MRIFTFRYLSFLIIGFSLFYSNIYGQTTSDASLWMSVAVDKKLNKNHEFYAKFQSRLSDNFSTYNYSFVDFGLSNRITKNIKFDFSYVLNTRRRYENEGFVYIPRHQIYANITFKRNIMRFRIANRNQVQTDLEDGNFDGSRMGTDYFYRNKTTIKYKTSKKIEPYIYYEWYLRMNHQRDREDFIYRQRMSAGLEYRISKRKSISCFYMLQRQIRSGPDFVNAFGVTYNYSFKKPKKDKSTDDAD